MLLINKVSIVKFKKIDADEAIHYSLDKLEQVTILKVPVILSE